MSMGYDDDDPRRAEVKRRLRSGYYHADRPNVHASKFRSGARGHKHSTGESGGKP